MHLIFALLSSSFQFEKHSPNTITLLLHQNSLLLSITYFNMSVFLSAPPLPVHSDAESSSSSSCSQQQKSASAELSSHTTTVSSTTPPQQQQQPHSSDTSPMSDSSSQQQNSPTTLSSDKNASSNSQKPSGSQIALTDPLHTVQFYENNESKFVIGTDSGFYCFSTHPQFQLISHCDMRMPIEHVVVLNQDGFEAHKSGATVAYVRKACLILFDEKSQTKKQAVQFSKPILGLGLIDGFFLVQLEQELRVLDFQSLKKLATFRTFENSTYWAAYSKDNEATIAYPAQKEGHIHLVKMKKRTEDDADIHDPIDINAHKSAVRCLAINHDGSLFATSSQRGTVIRVYKTEDGKLVKEVRRGTKPVTMYSIAFSHDNKYMCCYSSSGTVHIFGLGTQEQKENTYSSMYMLSYVGINYLSSEWSMAEYSVLGGDGRCAFAPNSSNMVNVATTSGRYVSMKFNLDKKEQDPEIEEKDLFDEVKPSVIDSRKREAIRFKETVPGKIPLFVDRKDESKLPFLKKRRYLVPKNIYMADFIGTIHQKLDLPQETKLVMFVGDDTEPQAEDVKLEQVYEEKKSEDEFLYVKYSSRDE